MTPASESGDETIGFGLQPNANAAAPSSIGNTAAVETVTPGSPNALPDPPAAHARNGCGPCGNDGYIATFQYRHFDGFKHGEPFPSGHHATRKHNDPRTTRQYEPGIYQQEEERAPEDHSVLAGFH